MTALRHTLDFAVDFVTSCLWALAAFFIGARLLSPSAGLLLALAVFVTAMTFILTTRTQERRARNIAANTCPRCYEALQSLHEHRRWDTAHDQWLAPLTTWHCPSCGFEQDAPLLCDTCPTAH